MVHILKTEFNSNPNIGFYGLATDTFCLLGKSIPNKHVRKIEEVLRVPVFKTTIYNTSLIGIFAAANSSILFLPSIIRKIELEDIRKNLDSLNVKIVLLDSKETALGNNILLNDKFAVVSSTFPDKNINIIKNKGLLVYKKNLANNTVPGSSGVLTNKGAIFHLNLSNLEIKELENLLGFEIGIGSVNMGSPWVRSGIIANSYGFVIGKLSSGFEIARVDESLKFIKSYENI